MVKPIELLDNDLVEIVRSRGLAWQQKEHVAWWQKLNSAFGLDYQSEEEAIKKRELVGETRKNTRDYRILEANTSQFYMTFVQGPLEGPTHPQGFNEYLEIALGKRQDQIVDNPKLRLCRHTHIESCLDLKVERFFRLPKYRTQFHNIPEAVELIGMLIRCSAGTDDRFFASQDSQVQAQMKSFKLNLIQAFGLALAESSPGISVSYYNH